jgi:hypothetical protein
MRQQVKYRVVQSFIMLAFLHGPILILFAGFHDSKPAFVPCDLRALDGLQATTGTKTTDFYLANLAESHGLKWATLDEQIKHPAAFVLPAFKV